MTCMDQKSSVAQELVQEEGKLYECIQKFDIREFILRLKPIQSVQYICNFAIADALVSMKTILVMASKVI